MGDRGGAKASPGTREEAFPLVNFQTRKSLTVSTTSEGELEPPRLYGGSVYNLGYNSYRRKRLLLAAVETRRELLSRCQSLLSFDFFAASD